MKNNVGVDGGYLQGWRQGWTDFMEGKNTPPVGDVWYVGGWKKGREEARADRAKTCPVCNPPSR